MEPAESGRAWPRDLLYFTQLVVNGLTLGCLYGLLAIGYTLVYGILDRINLAFGEIAIVGAYTTFIAVTGLALLGRGRCRWRCSSCWRWSQASGRCTGWRPSGWCSGRCARCRPRRR